MAITTSDTAKTSNVQHTKPCHDCPWRRKAVRGWLGGMSADEWVQAAHGDGVIDCHTVKGDPQPQCVGAATYRANVCKSPRDRRAIDAERDRENVFKSPTEFKTHHETKEMAGGSR